jgi:hypothetical protein
MIRPVDCIVGLARLRQHWTAVAHADARTPFPVALTSCEYVVASRRGGSSSTPLAHRGLSRQTTGEVVTL